jgi:hypothetical protein
MEILSSLLRGKLIELGSEVSSGFFSVNLKRGLWRSRFFKPRGAEADGQIRLTLSLSRSYHLVRPTCQAVKRCPL